MSEGPDLPEVTDELLAALEFRYASPRVCRVCGAPVEMVNSDGMKYTCTSDAASPTRDRQKRAGVTWQEALDHWSESTMYNPPDGDLRVLALVAEVRRLYRILPVPRRDFDHGTGRAPEDDWLKD